MERPTSDAGPSAASIAAQMLQHSTTSTPKTEEDFSTNIEFSDLASTSVEINVALKYCRVCGDVAKSYHFGGLSCDSCKAFFRRSVQSDNYLNFQCCHRGQCIISLSNRKTCQYCRMKRCFDIGMEKSWVMTEEERKALMKARLEKRNSKQLADWTDTAIAGKLFDNSSMEGASSDYEPQVERMTDFLTPLEVKEIESIVTKYMHAYRHVPYRTELRSFDNDRPGSQILEMFSTLIRRFAFYARLMPDFASLPFQDQSNLLKNGVLELCVLRGALVYDPVNNRWPNTNMSMYNDAPLLRLDNVGHFTSIHIFRMHLEFIRCIQQMGVDEPIIMLVILIVLLTPDREGLIRMKFIEKCQSYYTYLLERYMNWRFGPQRSTFMFGKLLTKLSDLRELCDSHNTLDVQLAGNDDISSIQQRRNLKLDPQYGTTQKAFISTEHDGINDSIKPTHQHPSVSLCYQQKAHAFFSTEGMSSVSADGQQSQTAGTAMQFVQAMQQSIIQVVNASHFGFEDARPDFQFEQGQSENLQQETSIHNPWNSLLTDSKCSYNETISSSLPPAALTTQTMVELYEELEELEEYPQFYAQQNSS